MATTNVSAGQLLKALIMQNGSNIKDLAPRVGYSRGHLSTLINANEVTPDLVRKIEDALNIDLSDVLRVMDEEPRQPPGSAAKVDELKKQVDDLRKELQDAYQTINNLSAVIRQLTAGKT